MDEKKYKTMKLIENLYLALVLILFVSIYISGTLLGFIVFSLFLIPVLFYYKQIIILRFLYKNNMGLYVKTIQELDNNWWWF